MSKDAAIPCFSCGDLLENVDDDILNQPYKGTAFITHGHYGSTVFDPMDGSFLEINICDKCLRNYHDRVLLKPAPDTTSYGPWLPPEKC